MNQHAHAASPWLGGVEHGTRRDLPGLRETAPAPGTHEFSGHTRARRASQCTLLTALLLLVAAGCDMQDMYDQPHYEPLEASPFFRDGQSARPQVAGTVARGQDFAEDAFHTGREQGLYVNQMPVKVDEALLARGQDRFNIYCAPCHGQTGYGNGMIVQRGLKQPPSYHTERIRNASAGHLFDVITNGYGVMPRYAVQLNPQDRWAVVAYIRALQLSQNAELDVVPEAERSQLQEAP